MQNFDQLFERSHAFAEYLTAALDSARERATGARPESAAAAAALSFEHAHALRLLLEAGTPNSASVLLRIQYEALLRAAWLMYAASEQQFEKLSAPLSEPSGAAAKNVRGADDMLKELERLLVEIPSLRGLVLPLREIRDFSWTAMNSFVHGGLHPLERTRAGFPLELAADILRNSNGMLHMTARLLARLTPSVELVDRVEVAYREFTDCLPVINSPESAPVV